MTINVKQLIDNALNAAEAEVPEGYVRTANLDIIPQIGRTIETIIRKAAVRTTRSGFPRIMIQAQEKSFFDNKEVMYSFFDNLSFSDSDVANKITVQNLLNLGVSPELVTTGDLEAMCEFLAGRVYNAEILDHTEGEDGRVFLDISWNTVAPPQAVADWSDEE